jgi:hypothetical protein
VEWVENVVSEEYVHKSFIVNEGSFYDSAYEEDGNADGVE